MTTRAPDTRARGQAPSDEGRAQDCFHCGLPVPAGTAFGFEAEGGWRAFCCPGCETVSRAISGLGLDDYYRLREQRAAPGTGHERDDLGAFDAPAVRARFVRELPGGLAEADLLLEGLRCAACAWLVEQSLARAVGVTAVEVSYGTRRAAVRFDPALARPSDLLAAVARVGYAAWPYEEGRLALVEARERRSLLRRLGVAGFGMMQVMMYAYPAYIAAPGDITPDLESLMRWAGLLITLPVVGYSAGPFFQGAARDLRLKRLGMDVPIALGLAVAFLASAWTTVQGHGEVYFDSVTMFVFLLLGGRYLELVARMKAGQSLQHLARLVPRSAHRLAGDGTALSHETVPVAALQPGDRVLVKPGETVPADGALESESATLGEAWLTGESRPVAKRRGDPVVGGSINAGSACRLRVTRVGGDTALSSIHRAMERALNERPRWVAAAERASAVFVALILAASIAAAATWLAIDPSRALWIAVSVLIVTCPCALALATPVALTVAGGAMARRNLVVTRGRAIEVLATATDFVFDKTGTVTRGEPRVLETIVLGDRDAARCLAIAGALASASSHPLDRGIALASALDPRPAAHSHHSEPGHGIEAVVEGVRTRMGTAAFAGALHGQPPSIAWMDRETVVWLADTRGWIAALRMGDTVRPEAREALRALRRRGMRVHLLSGDEPAIVERTASELGIVHARARATPDSKRAYVRELQRRGARVAMIGDGINDAPVLAQADVSVAMGGGADLAQVRADAVLLSDCLEDFAAATHTARRARRVIRQNLGWALAYNAIAVPLAFAGLVTPLVAGIGMSASSLVVVANALRLRG